MSDTKKYLDAKGVATELGISVDQVKALIGKGRLPAINVGVEGRTYWRVSREDLDTWIDGQRAAAAAQATGGAA